MVGEFYAYELSSIHPLNENLRKFTDYLIDYYIDSNLHFPPEMSSSMQRTTNTCENFHSKFNSFFYTSHPNIHQFLNVLKQCQTDTYIKMTSSHNLIPVKRRAKHLKKQPNLSINK